tara:strand:- start:227 stop:604 length:378 start_codon:yes stop_codon:yes gene_type:complete
MRKIEREMIQAIIDRRSFNKANTSVSLYTSATQMGCGLDTDSASEMRVHLHGNHIASYTEDGRLYINDQGWKTVTTKSRLNALIKHVLGDMSGIYQKNFNWFMKQVDNATGTYDEYEINDGWYLV